MSYEAEALMGSYVSDDEIIFRLENLAGPLPPIPSSWKKASKQKHAKMENVAALEQQEEAADAGAPPSKEAETAELAALLADLQRAVAHTGAPAVARSTKLVKKRVNRKPKAAAEGEGAAPEPAPAAAPGAPLAPEPTIIGEVRRSSGFQSHSSIRPASATARGESVDFSFNPRATDDHPPGPSGRPYSPSSQARSGPGQGGPGDGSGAHAAGGGVATASGHSTAVSGTASPEGQRQLYTTRRHPKKVPHVVRQLEAWSNQTMPEGSAAKNVKERLQKHIDGLREDFNQVMHVSIARRNLLSELLGQFKMSNATFESFESSHRRMEDLSREMDRLEDEMRRSRFTQRTWEEIRRRNEDRVYESHILLDQLYEMIQEGERDKQALHMERRAVERQREDARAGAKAEAGHLKELTELRARLLERLERMQAAEASVIRDILENRRRQEEEEVAAEERRQRRDKLKEKLVAERMAQEAERQSEVAQMAAVVDKLRHALGAHTAEELMERFHAQMGSADKYERELRRTTERLEALIKTRESLAAQRALYLGELGDFSRTEVEKPIEEVQATLHTAEDRAATLSRQLATAQRRITAMLPAIELLVQTYCKNVSGAATHIAEAAGRGGEEPPRESQPGARYRQMRGGVAPRDPSLPGAGAGPAGSRVRGLSRQHSRLLVDEPLYEEDEWGPDQRESNRGTSPNLGSTGGAAGNAGSRKVSITGPALPSPDPAALRVEEAVRGFEALADLIMTDARFSEKYLKEKPPPAPSAPAFSRHQARHSFAGIPDNYTGAPPPKSRGAGAPPGAHHRKIVSMDASAVLAVHNLAMEVRQMVEGRTNSNTGIGPAASPPPADPHPLPQLRAAVPGAKPVMVPISMVSTISSHHLASASNSAILPSVYFAHTATVLESRESDSGDDDVSQGSRQGSTRHMLVTRKSLHTRSDRIISTVTSGGMPSTRDLQIGAAERTSRRVLDVAARTSRGQLASVSAAALPAGLPRGSGGHGQGGVGSAAVSATGSSSALAVDK